MKKALAVLLVSLIMMSVTACGHTGSDYSSDYIPDSTFDQGPLMTDDTTNSTDEMEIETTTTRRTTTTTKRTTTTTRRTTTTKKTTTTTKAPATTAKPTVAKPRVYGVGENWVVPGNFEFKITSVYQHRICGNTNEEFVRAVDAVIVNYSWKNLGYEDKLSFTEWDLSTYDQSGEEGEGVFFNNYCDHGKEAGSVIYGGTGSASLPVALFNANNRTVTILVEKGDYSATFNIPVTAAPPEPEEDKLNGCTITLDATLPETYSYYNYKDEIEHSCVVTDVTFEVDGDDLDLYFDGRKTYDSKGTGQSAPCKVSWKLYEVSSNTVVANGTVFTLGIAVGEGFVDAKSTAYNCIKPSGTYRVVLLNTN